MILRAGALGVLLLVLTSCGGGPTVDEAELSGDEIEFADGSSFKLKVFAPGSRLQELAGCDFAELYVTDLEPLAVDGDVITLSLSVYGGACD